MNPIDPGQYLAIEVDGMTYSGLPDAVVARAAHAAPGSPAPSDFRAARVPAMRGALPEATEREAAAVFLTALCRLGAARVVAFGPPLAELN